MDLFFAVTMTKACSRYHLTSLVGKMYLVEDALVSTKIGYQNLLNIHCLAMGWMDVEGSTSFPRPALLLTPYLDH